MEDAHTHILSLNEDRDAAFFAVYDGHGGAKVAQYAGNNLHKKIVSQSAYQRGDIEDAIRISFLELDSDMLIDESMRDELAGTTAVVVLIKNNKIYCVRFDFCFLVKYFRLLYQLKARFQLLLCCAIISLIRYQ